MNKRVMMPPNDFIHVTCAQCGDDAVDMTVEVHTFDYMNGKEIVKICADVPVYTCRSCNFEFTDERAEISRHAAVCDYLGLLRPEQIRSIRGSISRAEFARTTGLGEATIARWESGSLLQNVANDTLLRLLMVPKNMTHVRENIRPSRKSRIVSEKFRALDLTDATLERAKNFSLRRVS